MKKRNYLLLFVTLLFSACIITSCSSDDDDPPAPEPTPTPTPTPEPEPSIKGVYILNSGSMGKNNSTLDFYDFETGVLNAKVFSSLNGGNLGDTGNDMIIYGSKMYITVTNSNAIEITDLSAKSIKKIQPKNDKSQPQSPRYLASGNGKVYVTMSDGFLAQLDTASLEIEKQVEVGLGAEQMCIIGDKLYTTTYGSYPDYDNKVISVDIPGFMVADKIEVDLNPTMIQAGENGMLYVLSSGNYFDIKQTVQRVDPVTKERKSLLTNSALSMSMAGDYLYIVSGKVDDNWVKISTDYKKYNLKTDKFEDRDFVNSSVSFENATFAYSDTISNQVYITDGTYSVTGKVHIISKDGELVKSIDVSGINPICVRFLIAE